MDKILFYIKKTFLILQNIIKQKGLLFFIGSYFSYFKQSKSILRFIKQQSLVIHSNGFFSNYLYQKIFKHIPDLLLIFKYHKSYIFLKELKYLGIPTIGLINSSTINSLVEYPICLNTFSYFIHFFLLITYSKLILLNR